MRIGLGLGIGFVRRVAAAFAPVTYMTYDQWSAGEAPADADTRKTRAIATIPFQTGYVIRAYRGTNPLGVLSLAQTAAMPFTGGVYDWTSVGQASLGAVVYVRIARSNPDGSGLIWLSDAKSFIASDVPDAPAFTFTPTAAGASTLTFTAPVWNRRTGTGGEYQINGGAWVAFTGTSTLNLTGLSGTTDNVGVRWVNANGNSGVTTQNVASGSAPVLTASSSVAGRVVTISATATGTPTPTVALTTLTLDGVDVSGSAVAGTGQWTYTVPSSSNAQTVAWLVTANNTAGNATGSGSDVIAADLAAPGTVPNQTAYFGASTASGAGGFMPLNSDGEDVALTGIVSGGGTSPAAQIVNGRLSFSGVGAPNGAAITCSHATGNVVITIASVSGAKSVATTSEIYSALFVQRSAGSTMQILMRPGDYDVNAGGAQANGIFHAHIIPQAAATTLKAHTGQAQRPRFVKPNKSANSYCYSLSWVTIQGVDFWFPNGQTQMLQAGTTGSVANRTHDVTLRDVRFMGPEVPLAHLTDTNLWTSGYMGILGTGPKFSPAYNITLENVSFENVWTGGDYSSDGTLTMRNVTGRNIYYDFLRIAPDESANPNKVKIFENIRAYNFFAINNEMFATTGNLEPHNDFMQVIQTGVPLKYAVFRNCVAVHGATRGAVVQGHQNNSRISRCMYHENMLMNLGSSWGFNSEGADYVLVNQCTYVAGDMADRTSFRFGSPGDGGAQAPIPAYGEQRIRRTYIGNGTVGNSVSIGNTNALDPATIVNDGSFYTDNISPLTLVRGPAGPADTAAAILAARPVAGAALDTGQIGALTVAGAFRGTTVLPMCGLKPTLTVSGADLIVAPNVSMYYDVLPTQWQYRKRIGPYTFWGAWSAPTSAASVTLSGGAVNDTQVQYRWLRADGEPGVISEESTVTGGASPPITTGPAISYVNSGIATLATSVQNRSITLWPTAGSADSTKMHLIGTFLRQTVGSQRTVGADPLTFVNQSDAVSASLTNLATGVNTTSGANRRLARLSANTPTSAEKGARASFSNGSGSYTSQMAAAAVKIDGAYSVITTAEAYAGGNMGTAAALSAPIYLPAAGRLVVFAYTTDSAAVSVTGTGPSTVNFTEVGNIADGSVGRIVTLISNTDMAQGSYTINGSTLQGLQVAAVANP